jgi:hypothetical protein
VPLREVYNEYKIYHSFSLCLNLVKEKSYQHFRYALKQSNFRLEALHTFISVSLPEIHKLIKLIWNKELPHQWKVSIVVPIHKKADN